MVFCCQELCNCRFNKLLHNGEVDKETINQVLFSFLQVKNKTDYQIASKRYSSALSENKFLYDTEDYTAEIYFAGELFTSGELNFPIYENAAKDYLKNAITGISTQLKRIR